MNPRKIAASSLVVCLIVLIGLILPLNLPEPVFASSEGDTLFQTIAQFSPEINKKFNPIDIPPGGISRLTVEIFNPNDYALSNVAFVDVLNKMQPGIEIAADPQASTTCGGNVSAEPHGTEFSLSGGTVGPKVGSVNGSCSVAVNVTSFISGNLDNAFVPGDLTAEYDPPEGVTIRFSNSSGVTETLNVAALTTPYVNKSFSPTSIWVGGQSGLRVTVQNRDATYPLHEVSITDNLPTGLVLATPVNESISPNCGPDAVVNAVSGTTSVTLSHATIPADASCYFDVYVLAATEGSYVNTLSPSAVTSYEGVTNPDTRSATLTVNGVDIYKEFDDPSILAGEDTSVMTITITNPYTQTLTGAGLVDDLPGDDLIFVPDTLSTTCETSETPASLTLSESDTVLTLSDATIPAGTVNGATVTPGSCTITATVTAPGNAVGGGDYNIIPQLALTNDQNITNAHSGSDYIYVEPQSIGVEKTFSPDRFELGGQTTVTIQLSNPTSTAIPNVNLTDDLPAELTPVIPVITSTTCGGDAVVTVEADSITLSDATIPAKSSCTFSAVVTTTGDALPGTYSNTIPAGSITGAGITNKTGASDSVVTYPENLGAYLYKDFDSNAAQPTGTSIRLYVRITAPEDQTLTNVHLVDTFPDGLVISDSASPYTSGCGAGEITANPGATGFVFSGGTVNAGSTCTINVYVTAQDPGSYTNSIEPEDLTNDQGQTAPSGDSDTLRYSDFTVSKSFSPTRITQGGKSVLTITLTNEDDREMTDVWLQDSLNTMGSGEFVVAPEPNASTTCGGAVTADPGANLITLEGGTIPAQSGGVNGSCTISVTVYANASADTSTNSISTSDAHGSIAGVTGTIPPRYSTSDQLTVADMSMALVKNFDPSSVSGGASSKLTVLLINPNDVPLTDITFTDVMPDGMEISQPVNVDTSTCGGEVTVASDIQSFTYSGGYLAAGRRCTISLNATIRVNGNRINTIPANAVSTFIGVTNAEPASSTLTNLPGVSVKKYFTPDRILAEPGEYAVLTINLNNTSNAPVPNMGLRDDFPNGLVVADVPSVPPTSSCGGTFTAEVGQGYVELAGGYLAGLDDASDPEEPECVLTVAVTAPDRGAYRNYIEENTVTSSDETVTNPDPAEDTLEVYGTPDMQIVKTVTSSGIYNARDRITYDIVVTNTGDITLNDVQVTDAGEDVVLDNCSPVSGSSLAPGGKMTCEAYHVVTAEDIGAGEYLNTATATSDKTDPVSDSAKVPLLEGPAISIDKSVSSLGPYDLGDTIHYEIVVTNIGTLALDHVLVSELTPDVVIDDCSPAQDSTLALNASMICSASYVVTQEDLDSGAFTNTASVDADQVEPESDTVTTQLAQFPAMAAYKYETSTGSYAVGDRVTFDIVVQNTGNTTLTGVTVEDTGTELPLGDCTRNEDPTLVSLPATLQINDILYCKAYHDITQADIDAGQYTNIAVADSDQTEPESATGEVDLIQIPLLGLEKTGILHTDVVQPVGRPDAGDTVTYAFTVTNKGNVTLHDITIADEVVGVQVSGGPLESLGPGESDSTTFTATYSLAWRDIDAGEFVNTATASGYVNPSDKVTASDSDTISLDQVGNLGVAKRISAEPEEAGPGTWRVTYEITLTNMGNVTLDDLQAQDDLSVVFPAPHIFAVISLTSADFTVNWPGYTGVPAPGGDIDLLAGNTNALAPGESGSLTLQVEFVPANGGPFENVASAEGLSPKDQPAADDSQDGDDPDPDGDNEPGNNSDPTVINFGSELFDPPAGIKTYQNAGFPVLEWSVAWINNKNIVSIKAAMSDPIPEGLTFLSEGDPNGYALPPGDLPDGTTNIGVNCTADPASTATSTTYCYYEGPTLEYLRGRVVWEGVLGPDQGAGNTTQAQNEIVVTYATEVVDGSKRVENVAVLDADLNGDEVISASEKGVISASEVWNADRLPDTGFVPGVLTRLPEQPSEKAYTATSLTIEIPKLGLSASVMTVPFENGTWDVTWLGDQVGYLEGSAFPTWAGNTVLTAHVTTPYDTPGLFAELSSLTYGDQVLIHAYGRTYTYEMRSRRIVGNTDFAAAFKQERLDWVTLMTCTGFDAGSGEYAYRQLVRAVLVGID